MNEVSEASRSASRPPEAVVAKRRGISIVWIVPLVAAAIGAFLAYRAYTERGPTVTITFDTADDAGPCAGYRSGGAACVRISTRPG